MDLPRFARWRQAINASATRRGLLGGNRLWLAVFVGVRLLRVFAKAAKRGEMPVRFSQSLREGEAIEIRHVARGT